MAAEPLALDPRAAGAARLPTAVCLGWGVGSLGMSLMFNATGVLMLRYLTDYVGLAAALAGFLISASKVYDAFADVAMGVVSDRTRSRWGRRRPYLALGAILCSVSFALLFQLHLIEGEQARIWAALFLLLLNATAYTVFNVPYLAMPAEMTTQYHERTRLMSFRVGNVAIGQLLASSLGPVLIVWFGGGAAGHSGSAILLAVFIAASMLACFAGTRNAPAAQAVHREFRLRDQFAAAAGNRPFVILIGVKLTYLIGLAMFIAVLPFMFTWVMKVSYGYLGLYFLAQGSMLLVSQPLWVPLTRRFGKKRTYWAATLFYTFAMLTWLAAGEGESALAIVLRGLLTGTAGGGLLLIGQSMLPDTMEYDFRRSGERREGLFAGLYTTVEKISFSIGPALTGIVLGASGYVGSAAPGTVQPESAKLAMYLCLAVLPALVTVGGALLLAGYRLDEELRASAPSSS